MDIKLLRKTPLLENKQRLIPLNGHPLDALIYMAHQHEEQYQRAYLIQQLWGSYEKKTQKSLSNLLFSIPEPIKDELMVIEDKTIYLKWENIEVDTLDFRTQAQIALDHATNFDYEAVNHIKRVLRYYQSHFLEKYLPQIEGLVSWREEQQLELARMHNILLETMVRLHIHYDDMSQAKLAAQKWFSSLDAGYVPLQYLIWITANQSIGTHVELDGYLDQLHAYEKKNPIRMGPTHQEWHGYLAEYSILPRWLLRLDVTPAVEIAPQYIVVPSKIIGRQVLIRQVLKLLLSNVEKRLVALTGLSGVGKSTVLYAVTNTIAGMPGMPTPLRVYLSSQSTFAQIIESIAQQLDHDNLQGLDIEAKKKRIQHILQSRQFVLIVDDYDGMSASSDLIDQLVDYVGRTPLLLATPQLGDIRFENITVQGLDADEVRLMLTNFGIKNVDKPQINEFLELTKGLPLLIGISLSFLKHYKIDNFAQLLAQLHQVISPDDTPDIEERYRRILEALQQNISPPLRQLLQLIALFDPLSGVSETELLAVGKLAKSNVTLGDKLDTLLDLSLLQPAMAYSMHELGEQRYGVHASVRRFLLPDNYRDAPQNILTDFVTVVADYIQLYQQDFTQLDKFRLNIERTLDLIFDQPETYCTVETHTELVRRIYYYLERRGLYELSIDLLLQTLNFYPDTQGLIQLELHHMLGQAYTRQSKDVLASQYLESALIIAQANQAHEICAKIYLDLALLDLRSQQFEQAGKYLALAYDLAYEYGQIVLMCRILINQGTHAYRQGDYAKAEKYFRHILDYLDELPTENHDDLQISFSAYKGLGVTLTDMGRGDEAQAYYGMAAQLVEQLNDPIRTAYLYLNIGVLRYIQGDYAQALNEFLRGKELVIAAGHSEAIALFYMNIGSIQGIRHEYTESEKYLKLALISAEENKIQWLKPLIYNNFGKLYLRQSITSKALDYFLKALRQANQQQTRVMAEALYGMILSQMLDEFTIGSNDIEDAREFVKLIADNYKLNLSQYSNITPDIIRAVHDDVTRDLNEIPALYRYCIAEALIEWFGGE